MGGDIDIEVLNAEMIAVSVVFVLYKPFFNVKIVSVEFCVVQCVEQFVVHFKIADGRFEISVIVSFSEMFAGKSRIKHYFPDFFPVFCIVEYVIVRHLSHAGLWIPAFDD